MRWRGLASPPELAKLPDMITERKSSKRTDWLIFGVTLVITLAFLIFNPTWFWVTLPFVLTYFVKGIGYM